MHINTPKEEIVETLFKEHFEALCRFSTHYISNFETAKDIVHEVFTRFWEKFDALPGNTNYKSYLFTAVRNKSFNYLRDQRHHLALEDAPQTEAAPQADAIETQQLAAHIAEALNQLPDACRNVFELSRYESLKYVQIAEKLGISVKTVEAQMSKALRILRAHLKDFLLILIFWSIT